MDEKFEIINENSQPILKMSIEPGGVIIAETGSIISKSKNIEVGHTREKDLFRVIIGALIGLLPWAKFKWLANKIKGCFPLHLLITSPREKCEVLLGSSILGSIVPITLDGTFDLFIKSGSAFFASLDDIRFIEERNLGKKELFDVYTGTGIIFINIF
jgi:uncharacterized protein (AIM24 family)